jgi:iron uptake system component EfeO
MGRGREQCRTFLLCFSAAVGGLFPAIADVANATPLDDAVERYRGVLIEDVGSALAGALRLHVCIVAGDAACARQWWIEARGGWERSEVVTGGFVPQLDRQIDAWPEAATGFHAIEARLFGANRVDVEPEVRSLVQSLTELDDTIRTIRLTPQGIFDGIAQLAFELGASKVDGGESRVSGTSFADMRNNAIGIAHAYDAVFAAAIEAAEPALASAAERNIAALRAMLMTGNLKGLDHDGIRVLSEELVVTLQKAAPAIGLKKPALEHGSQ